MFDNISVLFLGLGQICPLASQSVGGSNRGDIFERVTQVWLHCTALPARVALKLDSDVWRQETHWHTPRGQRGPYTPPSLISISISYIGKNARTTRMLRWSTGPNVIFNPPFSLGPWDIWRRCRKVSGREANEIISALQTHFRIWAFRAAPRMIALRNTDRSCATRSQMDYECAALHQLHHKTKR